MKGAMQDGELGRVRFAFGLLGAVPVFLAGWLGWLQVAQAGELERKRGAPLRLVPATADRQAHRTEVVPSPRGTIVDRHGNVMALDCETYEVRADIVVPLKVRLDVAIFRSWLVGLTESLALALVADPDLADRDDVRARHTARLAKILQREFRTGDLPASGPIPDQHPLRVDLLVASEVEVLAVVDALRRVVTDKRFVAVDLHFLRSYRRAYPERNLTHGIVGHINTAWVKTVGGIAAMQSTGVCGLESLATLAPEPAAARGYLKDGSGRAYFTAPLVNAPTATVLHSTLDLDMQRIALRELTATAEAGAREGVVTIPKWGAMVLVEIATGDVVAAASWHRGQPNPAASPFTPMQNLCEPGSIVKPLVLAYAYEAGVLDWGHTFDCTSGSSEYRERIASLGRGKAVKDDHPCHELTPHGILVNSSNIGASYVGLLLEREQWRDYLRFYGFGAPLGLQLPNESLGGPHRDSFDPTTPIRRFRANTAISFSFGYELQVTTLHMARAYLRLFRGANAELRVCRGAEVDGQWHPAPAPADSGPRFRQEVVDAVRAAMVDVVSSDPHATGAHLHRNMLKEVGIDLHGVIAGKTGTAASRIGIKGRGSVDVRNASFVGFMPTESPRWLAVCVLQKDDSARFYGGTYAAPPVVRLLLQCQQLEQRRLMRQESPNGSIGQDRGQSGSPGDSGWGRVAPETTSVGR